MPSELWSYLLSAVGLAGFFLAGSRIWYAWYINIANQFLWTAYAIVTDQLGFLIASAVYTVMFSFNAYRWTRDRHTLRAS